MRTLQERLTLIMAGPPKVSQASLARACGITAPSVNDWLSGKTRSIEGENLLRAAEFLNVEALWLATGKGAMRKDQALPGSSFDAASKVLEMLQKHKGLNAEARQQIVQAVEQSVAEVQRSNVITGDFSRATLAGDEIRIVHYDVQGAMGEGKLVHDYPEMFRDVTVSQQHLRELGVTYKDPSHLKLISGDGQSMAPTIQDKDPLIVDASIREFTGDGIYAFIWDGLFYIKRLQRKGADHFKMISDNKHHDAEDIRVDQTYIQARVLLVWNAKRV